MTEQRFSSKRILVGFDPRRADTAPVEFGVLCRRLSGAQLIIAAVEGERGSTYAGLDADLLDDSSKAIDELEVALDKLKIPYTIVRLKARSAAEALHGEAERTGAKLLVAGSSRRADAGRVQLGSTAARLFHGSPCAVAAVPSRWTLEATPRPETVAVAYVDTEEGHAALRSAYALARSAGARLRVITVIKVTPEMPLETEAPKEGQAGKDLEDVEGEHVLQVRRALQAQLAECGADVETDIDVFVGDPESDPAVHLVRVSEHVDVMVCGSRGYGPLRAVLLGSVSAKLTAEAYCPVIVLPRGVRAPLETLFESPAPDRAAHPA